MTHATHPQIDVSNDETPTQRSVVLPVYDESPSRWSTLIQNLRSSGWDEVVVAVDDPDEATRRTADRLQRRPWITTTVSTDRRGKGGAIRDGLNAASGDVVGYVDADGAVGVDALDRLYRAVEDDQGDLAVASRNAEEASRNGQPVHRRLLGAGYRLLARRVTGVDLTDFQCGAKAFSRELWRDVGDDVDESGFAFDTELIARASRRGYDLSEHPIEWRDPGDSDVDVARAVPDLFGSLLDIRRSLSDASACDGDDPVHVALVTDHPPNRGHLAEYGEELALAYSKLPNVDVTVLSRTAPEDGLGEDHTYDVEQAWARDSARAAWGLLRELRRGEYDAVQFNVHMTYFGTTNAHRFLGLALPALARLQLDCPVVTTLHDMLEVVEADRVASEVSTIERLGARAATQLALWGDATTVTAESYREVIEDRYVGDGVVHVPHGTFARADGGVPDVEPPLTVLLFGFLGPTKDVATTVEAFGRIRAALPDAELVVAGDSHPDFPEYLADKRDQFGDEPGVRFTGYVEEDELDEVWGDASLVVMPYETCTGVSGVFQLAKSYGKPVVAFDNDGMRTSTVDTGGAAAFVPPADADALADRVLALWDDRDRLDEMARENAAAGSDVPMAETAARMFEVFAEHGDVDADRLAVSLDD